jgi:hypothetical protein
MMSHSDRPRNLAHLDIVVWSSCIDHPLGQSILDCKKRDAHTVAGIVGSLQRQPPERILRLDALIAPRVSTVLLGGHATENLDDCLLGWAKLAWYLQPNRWHAQILLIQSCRHFHFRRCYCLSSTTPGSGRISTSPARVVTGSTSLFDVWIQSGNVNGRAASFRWRSTICRDCLTYNTCCSDHALLVLLLDSTQFSVQLFGVNYLAMTRDLETHFKGREHGPGHGCACHFRDPLTNPKA